MEIGVENKAFSHSVAAEVGDFTPNMGYRVEFAFDDRKDASGIARPLAGYFTLTAKPKADR